MLMELCSAAVHRCQTHNTKFRVGNRIYTGNWKGLKLNYNTLSPQLYSILGLSSLETANWCGVVATK